MPKDLQTKTAESTAVVLSPEFQAMMQERVKQQLAEEEFDLPRIEIVHKVQQFKLPLPDEPIVKSFRAVYLGFNRFNAYWDKPAAEGETLPPTCVSNDIAVGSAQREEVTIGGVQRKVYGRCETCWFNEFGSDPKGGKGKACNNKGALLLWPLDLNLTLPCLLTVSATGLWVPKEITSQAVARGIAAEWMICRFELEVAGTGQNVYSTVKITSGGDVLNGKVTEEQCKEATELRKMFLPRVKTIKMVPVVETVDDVSEPIGGMPTANDEPPANPNKDGLPF